MVASHEPTPSCLEIEAFRRIIDPTLRPRCRLVDLQIFPEDRDPDIADASVQDVAELGLETWVHVSYVLQEEPSFEVLVGAVLAYITDAGDAVDTLHTPVLGRLVGTLNPQVEFVDQIIDALSAAIKWCIGRHS